MSEQDGGPAFPFVEVRSVNKLTGSPLSQVIHEGLSKRDEFAKAAFATLDASAYATYDSMAEDAYAIADAMLRARTRTSTESPTP